MEEWRDIVGYEGLYQVSNQGRVRSLDREVKRKGNSICTLKGKIKKNTIGKKGYLYTYLTDKNGNTKSIFTHRLVAQAFISNPENKPEIDHINGIRNDNRVENLRWVTKEENMNNPLTKENQKITNKRSSNPNSKMVICIFPDGNEILFKCKEDLKDYLSIGRGTIDRIIKSGKQYKPRKKKFEYLNGIKIIKVEESDINGK